MFRKRDELRIRILVEGRIRLQPNMIPKNVTHALIYHHMIFI